MKKVFDRMSIVSYFEIKYHEKDDTWRYETAKCNGQFGRIVGLDQSYLVAANLKSNASHSLSLSVCSAESSSGIP